MWWLSCFAAYAEPARTVVPTWPSTTADPSSEPLRRAVERRIGRDVALVWPSGLADPRTLIDRVVTPLACAPAVDALDDPLAADVPADGELHVVVAVGGRTDARQELPARRRHPGRDACSVRRTGPKPGPEESAHEHPGAGSCAVMVHRPCRQQERQ